MKRRQQLFAKTLFMDVLANTLMCIVAVILLTDPSKKTPPMIDTNGRYAVVVTWPDASQDDVDTYVRDPGGNIVYFNRREVGIMHLERDDRGQFGDRVNGVILDHNEERVIFRGTQPGEHVVTVQMYAKRSPEPTMVTITLVEIKPFREILRRQRVMIQNGEERTAFRFMMGPDGTIIWTSDLHLEKGLTGVPTTRRSPGEDEALSPQPSDETEDD